jgi:metal-responsive CopG/Arc/MetJ family transcriptional regulator
MKKERISIRLDNEVIKDLKLVSELEGESISFIIRTILRDYLNYYLFKNTDKK